MALTKAKRARREPFAVYSLIEIGPKIEEFDYKGVINIMPTDDASKTADINTFKRGGRTGIDLDFGPLRRIDIYFAPITMTHPPFEEHSHHIMDFTTQKNEFNPNETDKVNAFLKILHDTFDVLKPICMWAGLSIDINWDIGEVLHRLPHDRVYGAAYYGAAMVELIGRERLLSAPVWRVEERPWGGVILQLEENPYALEDKKLPARVAEHLRLAELDFSSVSPPFEWVEYDPDDYDDFGRLKPKNERAPKKKEKRKPWE